MARIQSGSPYPLGAVYDGEGTNFALFSSNATKVELCLFDPKGKREQERITLPEYTDEVRHGYVEGLQPGQLYGYRVYGPYEPQYGFRFNPHKLLLDPYAKQLSGSFTWHDALFGYHVGSSQGDLKMDRRDSAGYMPKCCVVAAADTAGPDEKRPARSWNETIVYEAHVKGCTQRHPDVPEHLRGTFAGLAQPGIVDHLVKLGVTAIELLPIHAFVDDRFLIEKGLRNYWGYNSIGFFAPDPRYLSAPDIHEFRACVSTLHQAGIEVILDVVYNHTVEGNEWGPTLCFKGIDNSSYYRLCPGKERYYYDTTGCGNTLNVTHPRVLQMVMDSLRYWVTAMRVDGFRFDLASTLGREYPNFDRQNGFFRAICQDPLLSRIKMIAEPWDTGENGYQVGGFPPGWSEWNGKYRDCLRGYWKGDEGKLPDLAARLTGSADLYHNRGRRPWASINFITAHDGFTLADLVSYNDPHNEANQEDSGHNDNKSWNCGEEGPTEDADILALRQRQSRNFLATLFFSQGVPMLLSGDEMGKTQQGNNNAYCQDNEISWLNWELNDEQQKLLDFTRRVIALRRQYPVLRQAHFFSGQPVGDWTVPDISWLSPNGTVMQEEDWKVGYAKTLGMHFIDENNHKDTFLLLLNAADREIPFTLPPSSYGARWQRLVDTFLQEDKGEFQAGDLYPIESRSLALLKLKPE